MMGVSGLPGDTAYPTDRSNQMPPIPLGRSGEALAKGFNRLGWHWWPSDVAIATQPFDGRAQCINLGACLWGCAQGAKGSTDVTYWPHAKRAGVEVWEHCRVSQILVGDVVDRLDLAGGRAMSPRAQRGEKQSSSRSAAHDGRVDGPSERARCRLRR